MGKKEEALADSGTLIPLAGRLRASLLMTTRNKRYFHCWETIKHITDNTASQWSCKRLSKGDVQLGSHRTALRVPIIWGGKKSKKKMRLDKTGQNHYTLPTEKRCQYTPRCSWRVPETSMAMDKRGTFYQLFGPVGCTHCKTQMCLPCSTLRKNSLGIPDLQLCLLWAIKQHCQAVFAHCLNAWRFLWPNC